MQNCLDTYSKLWQSFGSREMQVRNKLLDVSFLTSTDFYNGRYCFFDYVPGICGQLVEGCINWDDQYTTLSENNSALSAWYGEGGIIETMINYELHRGLDLLGDNNG